MLFRKPKNQKGFTLIEIIAVLVILGILAAVAIPKFINMHIEAKNKAMERALAAGASEVLLKFSNMILTGSVTPSMTDVKNASSSPLGDFEYTYLESGTTAILITVIGPTDKISGVTVPTSKKVVFK